MHSKEWKGVESKMKDMILHAATVFMGFFAIMNPIANVPVFLGLTSGDDQPTIKAVGKR